MYKYLILLLLVGTTYGRHEIYDGYKLYKTTPATERQLYDFKKLSESFASADVWSAPYFLGQDGLVSVPPEHQPEFITLLNQYNMTQEVVIENLKTWFLAEDKKLRDSKARALTRSEIGMTYETYPTHDEINNYLDELAQAYPDKVTVESGRSYEGREIKYLYITSSKSDDTQKPLIYVDAGIHAREWITPITAVYILDKLLKNVTESDLTENADWIVLPVVNPDGYDYSFTTERLWRKTRSPTPGECMGVDANRNFDFQWMFSGSSDDPCDITYAGAVPSSEPEVKLVSNIFQTYKDRIKLMLTIHSAANVIVYPWAYDGSDADNSEELQRIGSLAADAINVGVPRDEQNYEAGNTGQMMYICSGTTLDYAKFVGIPFTYTIELTGRGYSFSLPPEEIRQVIHETWLGIVVFAREIVKLFP